MAYYEIELFEIQSTCRPILEPVEASILHLITTNLRPLNMLYMKE